MAFRFRKIFKIFPGLKINASKSGLSASIGKPGASINFSKKGVRKTIGVPGTGVSWSHLSPENTKAADPSDTQPVKRGFPVYYTPTHNPINKKPRIKLPFWLVPTAGIVAIVLPAIFCISALISTPNSTPTPTLDSKLVQDQAMLTAWANYTLTVSAYSPTPAPTETPLPTATIAPPTETLTLIPTSTQTLIILPTATLVLFIPTLPPQSAICSCSGDSLNCGDFNYQSSAQACFNYCISQGAGDIHKLDGNNDGSACENLP